MSVHDNGLNQLDHGFYVTFPDGVIENSEVYNNAGYGIQIYDSACKGYPVEACANRMVIRGNRIHDNAGDGGVTLNHGNDILFQDNVLANNAGGGLEALTTATRRTRRS